MENQSTELSSKSEEKLTEELIWVRSMLRVFSKLERKVHSEMGDNGMKKIILKENYFLFITIFSIFIVGVGIYSFINTAKFVYLLTFGIPVLSFMFLSAQIKKAEEKNIFRFIAKWPNPDDKVLYAVEEYVFQERDYFEDIIAWQINNFDNVAKEKFAYLFDQKYWADYEKAQLQCSILAILMVSLQRHLHKHKRFYMEHVKKLPIMNEIQQEGYRKVKNRGPKSTPQNISPEDIQTFGGGFGFTTTNSNEPQLYGNSNR